MPSSLVHRIWVLVLRARSLGLMNLSDNKTDIYFHVFVFTCNKRLFSWAIVLSFYCTWRACGDRWGVATNFSNSAQQYLKVIKDSKDLNLPAHKLILWNIGEFCFCVFLSCFILLNLNVILFLLLIQNWFILQSIAATDLRSEEKWQKVQLVWL